MANEKDPFEERPGEPEAESEESPETEPGREPKKRDFFSGGRKQRKLQEKVENMKLDDVLRAIPEEFYKGLLTSLRVVTTIGVASSQGKVRSSSAKWFINLLGDDKLVKNILLIQEKVGSGANKVEWEKQGKKGKNARVKEIIQTPDF